MAAKPELVLAPLFLEQIRELGIKEQTKDKIRDAMADVEQAGKQLVGPLFPYRRLTMGRYRIVYRIRRETEPPQAHFLYAGIRKDGDKKDVYARLTKALRKGDLG